MNLNKKLNKLMKSKFNHYNFLTIKDNVEILSKYIYEDKNIFYTYLSNIVKNDYKISYLPNITTLFKQNISSLNTMKEFSFTKVFKIYFEFVNHEKMNEINSYFEKINNLLTNDKDYNNFLLEIIDTIYPYVNHYIDLIDFINNMCYKSQENHQLFSIYKTYQIKRDKIELLEKTFPILYPQYKDDFLENNLTSNEFLNFHKFYVLLKYIPKKIRKLLYEDCFLKNNYYNLLILEENFILKLSKFVDISSLQKEYFNFLTLKDFGNFIDKLENIIFIHRINLPRNLSFKELVMLFDYMVQEKQNVDFLCVYYLKSISHYKEIEIIKNIQQLKHCPINTLSFMETAVLTDELVKNSLKNRKENENPLYLTRDTTYFIYFYLTCYQEYEFKSSYQELLDNIQDNLDKLDETLLLILYFNMKKKTNYNKITEIKEVKFFIQYLSIPEVFIHKNESRILENLINDKYVNLVRLCQSYPVTTNLEKKRRVYSLAQHLILNQKLDIKKEMCSLSELLNYPFSIKELNKWEDVIDLHTKNYQFKEINDIHEKWDIGLSPVRTCIAWDRGVFKDTLPSIFSPHMKVLKIYKNNQCIGRTIISLNMNSNNKLSLLIHKIYAKNTALSIQKEIGCILFETLKPLANELNADLLLFIGRKRTKTGLYTETNELNIVFKQYEMIVTYNIFDFFFDPLGLEYTSEMKRRPITLLLDDVCYTNNRS